MSLLCIGMNHRTAPVEIREKLALAEKDLPAVLREVCGMDEIAETVVLATCNRVEVYAMTNADADGAQRLHQFLREHFGLSLDEASAFYLYEGFDVATHLFKTASGLDSMVLGETEIFGQVKKAYHSAHRAGTTSRGLNKLFQQAFRVGKMVRSSTQITRGSTSVGSVAVDLAEKIFGDLKHCQVMIIGAGDMSRRTAKSLLSRGAKSIFVSNRSYDRAVELAAEMEGMAVHFDEWIGVIPQIDIMITSTAAPHTFIHPEGITEAMRLRRGRPLFVIDIAVPRDVDPRVNEIEGVYLYDIDALEAIAAQSRSKREIQVEKCERLIAAEIEAWDFPEGGFSGPMGKRGMDGELSDLSPAHE